MFKSNLLATPKKLGNPLLNRLFVSFSRFAPFKFYNEYEKCIFVRNNEDMCGKHGKYYEHKHGNTDDMKEFLKKLMRKFPRNDDMEFLQCPNWSC